MTWELVLLIIVALVNGETDPPFKGYYPASRYHSTSSPYGKPKGDSYRYSGNSFDSKYHPSNYLHTNYISRREAWSSFPAWNGTYIRNQNQKGRPPYNTPAGGYSMHQYHRVRVPITYKKTLYYNKFVSPEKPTFKKPQIVYYPMAYKKPNHPRVHASYAMNKYPTKKTVRPYHRRQIQNYVIPSSEMFRNGVKDIHQEVESSTSATTTQENTDYSPPLNYADYNRTLPNANYYDSYDEQTTAASYDDGSNTRFYSRRNL